MTKIAGPGAGAAGLRRPANVPGVRCDQHGPCCQMRPGSMRTSPLLSTVDQAAPAHGRVAGRRPDAQIGASRRDRPHRRDRHRLDIDGPSGVLSPHQRPPVEPRALPPLVHRKRRPPATARTRLANGRGERSTAVTTRSTAPSTSSAPSAPAAVRDTDPFTATSGVASGSRDRSAAYSPPGIRFRTARVPIVCRLWDSRQRLSLGNCQRMPFSFAGLAVSPPTECRKPLPGGTGGNPGKSW